MFLCGRYCRSLLHERVGKRALIPVLAMLCFAATFQSHAQATIYLSGCDSVEYEGHWYKANKKLMPGQPGNPTAFIVEITVNKSKHGATEGRIICDSVQLSGRHAGMYWVSEVGTYYDTAVMANGCDSIHTIEILEIHTSQSFYDTIEACDNYSWYGNYYESSTLDTTTVSSGYCIDTGYLYLEIYPTTYDTVYGEDCGEFVWTVDNSRYNASGDHWKFFNSVHNCDSFVLLRLTVHPEYLYETSEDVCDKYLWAHDGQNYTATTEVYDSLSSVDGCDSVYALHLTVRNSTAATSVVIACDDYVWPLNDILYDHSGIYTDTISNAVGCDSVGTLELTVNYSLHGPTTTASACGKYVWPVNGAIYINSGTYYEVIPTATLCDSTLTLDLTVFSEYHYENTVGPVCDSFLCDINHQKYLASTLDTLKFTSSEGCDSIYYLDITIHHRSVAPVTLASACDRYVWAVNGREYTATSLYEDTIVNVEGCDSVVSLDLAINHNSVVPDENKQACGSYFWPKSGDTYTSSGVYTVPHVNSAGCDSTEVLNLEVNSIDTVHIYVDTCDRYLWHGNLYEVGGIYNDTLTSSHLCDSVTILHLTLRYSTIAASVQVDSCDRYYWPTNGEIYNVSGLYSDTLTNAAQCDSAVSLSLVLRYSSPLQTTVAVVCDSFLWEANAQTYYSSGIYSDLLANAVGCDSGVALNLTVHPSKLVSETVEVCDSFYWHGRRYIASCVDDDTLHTTHNCDSVVVLQLTVRYGTRADTVLADVCDSYMWEANGNQYTSSGIYPDTIVNRDGCDSVVCLNLSVRLSSHGVIDTVETCDQFEWPVNGTTYVDDGLHADTLVNSVSCDSLVGLFLTLHHRQSTFVEREACDSLLWGHDERFCSTNGIYYDTLLSQYGCDSVIQLTLTLFPTTRDTVEVVACDRYEWGVNGMVYRLPGVYCDTTLSSHQCDSIVTLLLDLRFTESNNVDVLACDSFQWYGQTYTRADTTDIHGHFSVSGTDAVFFAPGNLQFNVSSGVWRFAAHQYDIVGITNTLIASPEASWIDLFGWGTSGWNSGAAAFLPSSYSQAGTDYWPGATATSNLSGATVQADWGMYNTIQNSRYSQAGQWRTLTSDEWYYLMHLRPNAARLHTLATVCDVPGLLLLPDKWEPIAGIAVQTNVIDYRTNIYDAAQWAAIEHGGAAFFPAAGYRDGSQLYDMRSAGRYWSASHTDEQRAAYMGFFGSAILASVSDSRALGMSVRLAHDTTGSTATHLIPAGTPDECDTLERLFLTIRHLRHGDTTSAIVCDSYLWPQTNRTYTSTGSYGDSLSTPDGCDSIIHLQLVVNSSSTTVSTVTACDSYLWNDSLYTQSAHTRRLFENMYGCDSTDSLYLQINHSNSHEQQLSVCDSHLWNGRMLRTSDFYSDTLLNSVGCDSVDMLYLSVRYSSDSTVFEEHCDSYTWPQTGQRFDASALATVTLDNAVGCDSVVTLSLVIHHRDSTRLFVHDCDSHRLTFMQQPLFADTIIEQMLSTDHGCDSVVVHNIRIDTTVFTHLADTVCEGEMVWLGDVVCDRDSLYSIMRSAASGCDSVVTLRLTVRPHLNPSFEALPDCDRLIYNISATDTYPLFGWSAESNDSIFVPDTGVASFVLDLSSPATYTLFASYSDSPYCVETFSRSLNPVRSVAVAPTASLSFPPEYAYSLELYSGSIGADSFEWTVNGTPVAFDSLSVYGSSLLPADTLFISLHAYNENCHARGSVIIPVDNSRLWVPNVFTPPELTNNHFRVRGYGIAEYEITIFNRRGFRVFYSNDINNSWDGRSNGVDCPMGNYVYKIRYTTTVAPGYWREKSGTVLLIR